MNENLLEVTAPFDGAVIELPEDIADEEVHAVPLPVTRLRRPAADHKAITQAVDLTLAAKNPIILAGKGAVPMDDPHCRSPWGLASGIITIWPLPMPT